ncbi:MAG: polyhydroxyalkanoic acid system family protein [Candidatus Thiodiazotropha sp. (ex. Lucinisca nassula)]|nr:polyhydroxyalkanoic acid system family protein [Candidatus Thiodiazotropha sp. (ex. Lucinisca nassula)]
MASIKLHYTHQLGYDTVHEKVEEIAQSLKEKLGAEYHWEDVKLIFTLTGANGWLLVGEEDLSIEIELGLVLKPLKGKIEHTIDNEIKEILS